MSQRDVWNILMENPKKWYLTKDITELCKCSKRATNTAIWKLIRNGEIEEKVISYKVGRYYYRDRYIRIGVKNEKR